MPAWTGDSGYIGYQMKMNEYNIGIAARVETAAREFEIGTLTLDEVQGTLASAASLFENDGSGVSELVRLVEADLELIKFGMLLEDQRPAAIFRLDELRTALHS